jgi:hypothetical protein
LGYAGCLAAVLAVTVCVSNPSWAETSPAGIGPTGWFDWTDFRLDFGVRLFLARLTSGSVKRGMLGGEFDLLRDYGIRDDPEPFRELWAALYVDRLAVRFHYDEERAFRGRSNQADGGTMSTLDMGTIRLGLDLDIVRYPFVRAGINFDYHNTEVTFSDRATIVTHPVAGVLGGHTYKLDEPITVGLHAKFLPFRIREVPATLQGRVRYSVPSIRRRDDARLFTFELAAGMRPNVWETSLLGHSSFSAAFEVGYRMERVELFAYGPDFHLTAVWQGPFAQMALVF